MTGRSTNESRIKGTPDRIVTTGKGGRTVYIATGLVRGKCLECGKIMYVESNEGVMACCGCKAPASKIEWTWGNTKIVFVPEGDIAKLPDR